MRIAYQFSEGELLPLVFLRLKGKAEWVEVLAYVDTGVSYSVFHADVAEILGLRLEDGELREMEIGDGNKLKVYLHQVLISLGGKEFSAYVGFSKGLGVGFNVIGRKSIFDKFIICFNEKEKYMEFAPLDNHDPLHL